MADNEEQPSGLFTCMACQVAFRSGEGQRNHYRSDWHRYNLKRKVADLPPITAAQFDQKLQVNQKNTEEKKAEQNAFTGECEACRKTFGTQNSFNNHIQSKKHKETVTKAASRPQKTAPKDTAEQKPATVDLVVDENMSESEVNEIIDKRISEAVRLTELECLFCTEKSDTFDDNMAHMTKVHSFFIPDIEYLVDLRGLIKYLGEKISVGNVCLYCNGKGRAIRSLEAVRAHMIDKGHCKIAYESDEDAMEVVDFYDFSSSYPQGYDPENPDVDAELAQLTNDIQLGEDEMELILPSGARIGHRSLQRYYKQSFKPDDSRDSVLINKLITQYTDDFGYESLKATSGRHPQYMITDGRNGAPTKKDAFAEIRRREDFKMKVGMQANNQKHFRIQILQ
ncbi:C2H2 type zinc-finger-domain-containing protein [Umbelopsis sp. PMI_123]|nr:C2H2 type zinc-finger-domain-containing protein [Umbelopsis sp. PMI_123]